MGGIEPIAASLGIFDAPERMERARGKKAVQDLEAVFIHTLLKEMRRTVPEGGLFEKSHAMKMYEEMFDEVMAEQMAKSGQFGLAKVLEQQILAPERSLEGSDVGQFGRPASKVGAEMGR